MPANVPALHRASDLLEDWAKDVGYTAMINLTDPNADAGIKLYATILTALAAKARLEAAELRMSAIISEASDHEE